MTATDNPLLAAVDLPDYAAVDAAHVEPAIRTTLAENRARLAALLAQGESDFAQLVEPFEAMQQHLGRVFAPVAHLNAVRNSDRLREAYNACLPLLAEYQTEVGQNRQLCAAYERISAREGPALSASARRVLEYALREFRLAGVRLPADEQARFKTLMQQLARLQSQFEEHVLDATQAFSRHLPDQRELAGLPEHVRLRAQEAARERGLDGYLLRLDQPTYMTVMSQAESRALREEFYAAWTTRASDQGPSAGRYDNSAVLAEILKLRHEAAQLLGFASYAELSLATKMAPDVPAVLEFLTRLAGHYLPAARRELEELERRAGHPLAAWDVAYYAERLREEKFAVSEEALRPYFPLPRVLEGVLAVAARLYGLKFEERTALSVWHPDVRYFEVLTGDGELAGGFYADLYARENKRGGAWMGELASRMRVAGLRARPMAHLVCNFAPPARGRPALLTHGDVVTLFHEFGHTLHHLLTRVDYPSLAGVNGVPWDAVELPSQLMEQWAWHADVLPMVSGHVDSGAPLPQAEQKRLIESRSFHAGLAAVRQLEFALFDFRIHAEYRPERGPELERILSDVRAQVAVLRPPAYNRFAHSFQHVFAGGYAAGYYSYKWAEVLAADAFAAFQESGVFDAATARRFLDEILSRGGSCDQMQAFVAFRGRGPAVEALLARDGLAA
jgi:oligopeptidase A